ncbi:iron-sulfur cluster assembly scaffold protein [Desulfonatronospira sp.]|uniref:iron-sulfur cluster assembly scaffold protein n=1 Tax=Desulfonatronospira sp. TaxID=1962951 RepID=UPI0025C2D8AB|nr:iron-sulfur cluster assembly scaffold protein [Desulfonatronospira sp.]
MKESMKRSFDELQARVDHQALQDFGPEVFRRWKNPAFMGRMLQYDSKAEAAGSCGNKMTIYLRLQNDVISEATFFSEGCGTSVVCASVTCELARGRPLKQAMELRPEDIMRLLPGLPPARKKYAQLGISALHRAVEKLLRPQSCRVA